MYLTRLGEYYDIFFRDLMFKICKEGDYGNYILKRNYTHMYNKGINQLSVISLWLAASRLSKTH